MWLSVPDENIICMMASRVRRAMQNFAKKKQNLATPPEMAFSLQHVFSQSYAANY